MPKIIKANAWCNNEVGYLAWRTDGPIRDCLGFMITRIHYDLTGKEVTRRILPAWVAFRTQSNPHGEEQDTSVWPVQKFSWRDLTLRRSRNETVLREGEFKARYEIVAVGLAGRGRTPVPASPTAPYRNAEGEPRYRGAPIPLFFCGKPVQTNQILVTNRFGSATVAFNNGISRPRTFASSSKLRTVARPVRKRCLIAWRTPRIRFGDFSAATRSRTSGNSSTERSSSTQTFI